jgi:sortase A
LRIRSIVSGFVSLALILGGLALAAMFFMGQSTQTSESGVSGEFNVPEVSNPTPEDLAGPADKTLTLTVPKMNRLDGVEIPDAVGNDEEALRTNAGIHLQGTGFPWQERANVYLAGHRMGYPGTESFLAFRDQQKLEKGDEVHVTDSEGTRYTYEVFSERIVGPQQIEVTQPVEGKNILTLQTCTFPDYSERIVTQAELVDVA